MRNTHPGATSRYWGRSRECINRDSVYLERLSPPLSSNPFKSTWLYSTQATDGGDDGYPKLWPGSDALDIPPERITPAFATHAHGRYRLEAGLPRGGWVSSAPDICRLLAALRHDNAVITNNDVVDSLVTPQDGENYTLAGMQVGASGYTAKGGVAFDTYTAMAFEPVSERRLAYSHLATKQPSPGYTGVLFAILEAFGE